MANSMIDSFKTQLQSGGVRSNQFRVDISLPSNTGPDVTEKIQYLCSSTTLPKQTIGTTEVAFRGRKLQLAGDSRTYEPWDITVVQDSFDVYDSFEAWQNLINDTLSNKIVAGNADNYKVDALVTQLDRDGDPIKTFILHGCFPSDIAAIDLSMDTDDEVQTFDVTLTYDYFTTASQTYVGWPGV
jgi:hypothetical protein